MIESLSIILRVFVGSVGITFLAWIIVHFNGKTLLGIIDLVAYKFFDNKINSRFNWLSTATEAEVVILGLVPIAIASLTSTWNGNCLKSIPSFLIAEMIVLCLFLSSFYQLKKSSNYNFLGVNFVRSRWVFLVAIIWCLAFSVWGYLATASAMYQGVDRLLVNGNGDMWYYIRRFAAYTVDNVSFDNEPACYYLQTSPKKLSSFIGSIIVYLSPDTVFGITLFQGLLGCSLFLSLFSNWVDFSYQEKSLSNTGTIGAVMWAIASPSVFWLIISSYLSNALFVSIFILGLTAARRICLRNSYPDYAEPALLFCFIVNIFSFYLVFLPVAIIFYLATIFVYRYEKYWQLDTFKNFARVMLITGISILLCCILFKHQISLSEVTENLNALQQHGKNFVPLNPWSLVQEKPNPMPYIKDFGVWFNIIVGIIVASFILNIIYRNLLQLGKTQKANTTSYKDLIAAALVIGVYILYLLAHIPLEYTYRLGKFAVSILYPLATVAILPTVLWFRDRFSYHKSRNLKLIGLVLLVLHIILHIDKTLYLGAQPIGKYQLISSQNISKIDSLTVVGCIGSTSSQKYEKLLGLNLAKDYSNFAINIITNPNLMNNFPPADASIRGINIVGEKNNLCIFELEL